jgi:glycosyltransferase involved in cell wall biosynthesis
MKVAIVDGDLSYPPTSGKRLRTLNLLLPLAKRHQITYIARSQDEAQSQKAASFLAACGIHPILIEEPIHRKQGFGFYGRLAGNLASPLPYSVASHVTPGMHRAVQTFAANNRVDLWQLEWSGYIYTLCGLTSPVVAQAHNIEALIWQRYRDTERRLLKRLYVSDQLRKMLNFERRAFRMVTRVITVSSADATLARDLYGELPIDVVDNGVDVARFSDIHPNHHSRTILFLGALDWRPNLDALEQLLEQIFPSLLRAVPNAKLAVVGRSPPAWLRKRVARSPNTELHADVSDVRPHLQSSAAMAVPLRIGGGSRLKILESLASGLPVVATAIGVEGLHIKPGRDFILADTSEEIVAGLAKCLCNPLWAHAQAERGRKTVASKYDWVKLADQLEGIWQMAANCAGPMTTAIKGV